MNKIKIDKNYTPYSIQYAPSVFTECIPSRALYILQELSKNTLLEGLPNMIIYGKSGSGKYTRLFILLKHFARKICDISKLRMKAVDIETFAFSLLPTCKNKKKVISVITSPIHIEIDMAQPYMHKVLIPFLDWYTKNTNIQYKIHKYIILRNIDLLDTHIQKALRKYMECTTTRFLCTTRSLLSIDKPIRSRLISLFIQSPSVEQSTDIIQCVCEKQKIKITPSKIIKIIDKSKQGTTGYINLHQLYLVLEGSVYNSINNMINNSDDKISSVYNTKRNEFSDILVKYIVKGNIMEIRNTLYEIYEKYNYFFKEIVGSDIFRILYEKYYKDDLVSISSKWNHLLYKNSNVDSIVHAEAYLYKLCELYYTR